MSIDTAQKRRSAAAVARRWGRGITPDATKPAAWRQEVGWGYSGIPAGVAVEPEPDADLRVLDPLYLAGLTTPEALRLTGLTTPAALALTGLTTLPALILEGDD